MSKNAQRLSAFVTNFGTYIPLRMPYGLKNAPYEFSRMVAHLLEAYEDFDVPISMTLQSAMLCSKNALKGKYRKGVVHWTEDYKKVFNSLKQALASKPVLHSPDYQFVLQTDASDNGTGVVLCQVTEYDKEHAIVYLIRKFSDVEKRYCVSEKECGVIIFGIQRLKYYLDGQAFTIVTDHNPLTWLKANASESAQILR
ncbi:hypothetical protein AVEN_157289-1 [Araneus ventricosus]|uniref:Reverse transcriptase RNase H-like domain-containing protein n=1 Tax=Araneus ventricosus TaxID=182803 RepID=A0A4Y2TM27_ARAVE|nr:hypothetical protein AVEN_157289-1 [Araneus ventricosus]